MDPTQRIQRQIRGLSPTDTSGVRLAVFSIKQWRQYTDFFMTLLSPSEQQRVHRYCVQQAADIACISRGVLRCIVGEILGCSPQALPIKTTPFGKPFVPATPLQFNVSHSHENVVVLYGYNQALGVDIEWCELTDRRQAMARRFFSLAERAWLSDFQDNHAYAQAFYDVWVGKEAVSKAVGKGMSLPLHSYSVIPAEPAVAVCVPGEAQLWHVQHVDLLNDYACAVCVMNPSSRVTQWEFIEG